MNLIDRFPLPSLLISALLLGSAPFVPEPHLVEKLRMLVDGTLSRPLDIFDLFLHASLPTLLIIRLARMAMGLPRNAGA
ncbi:MAG: RND transporter [Gammaproteobacteria bacterium]|nr:RND transporter [Gammaproteobacteria bacterium]MCP5137002.1 RND transporter [Gammaproteobacteria bacterium]